MNVDQIYQLQRDDAFATQFSADQYETFVAMPFSNRGGYPETRIKLMLVEQVHELANELAAGDSGLRKFAPLQRVDGAASGAVVITDEISRAILRSHFFLGDLTGANYGVVLESGIALALKPNQRVLLFTQDDSASLHFDLKVTNVNRYIEDDLVERSATALVEAARNFESESDKYIRFITAHLTPDGIKLLNLYGRLWKGWSEGNLHPSLFAEKVAGNASGFQGAAGRVAFYEALRELMGRRLMWTQYVPNASPGADSYGIHATKLGWRVIEHLWKHDSEMRQPPEAPTGPNLDYD